VFSRDSLTAVDLDEALDDALVTYARIETERNMLDTQLARLKTEIEGLRNALRRHGDRPVTDPLLAYQELPRTEVVSLALVAANGPESPTRIMGLMREFGRDDSYNAITAALAHLARSGRAHSVGRGMWLHGPPPPASDPADDDGPF
jgi:hypothetical protein